MLKNKLFDTVIASKIAEILLQTQAVKLNVDTPFTWASGWKSPIYCDNRVTLSFPNQRKFIKQQFVAVIQKYFPAIEGIIGVATAGIPQGALVADALGLPFSYVRSKPKSHGMGHQIEGLIDAGKSYVMVEDLISTGGSALSAARAAQAAGADIKGLISVFTYGFDLSEKAFSEADIPLVYLSDYQHLLKYAVDSEQIKSDQVAMLESWRQNPADWSL